MRSQRLHRSRELVSRRWGATLMELMVVVSLSGIILGIAGVLMQQMLRTDRGLARCAETAAHLSRLESLFRRDAWDATQAEIVANPEGTRLDLEQNDGSRVSYQSAGHILRRYVMLDGKETHRDRFAFPVASRIELEQQADPRRVRLTIGSSTMPVDQPAVSGYGPARRPFQLAASVGRTVYVRRIER